MKKLPAVGPGQIKTYILELAVPIPDDEKRINLNFYFHTFLWYLTRFYGGRKI